MTEAKRTIAAITCFYIYLYTVYKHIKIIQ
jgi:hypothetical protein